MIAKEQMFEVYANYDFFWAVLTPLHPPPENLPLYQGKGTGRDDPDDVADCGLGGNVVLKLTASLPSNHNFKIFADNYFSNLAMAGELAKQGFCYVGTIINKRLHGAPLKSEKELKKEGRGSYQCVVDTNAEPVSGLLARQQLCNRCVNISCSRRSSISSKI